MVHRGWASLSDGELVAAGARDADLDLDLLDVGRDLELEIGWSFDVAHDEHFGMSVFILAGDLVKALGCPSRGHVSFDSEPNELASILLDRDVQIPRL